MTFDQQSYEYLGPNSITPCQIDYNQLKIKNNSEKNL